jgi:integrase
MPQRATLWGGISPKISPMPRPGDWVTLLRAGLSHSLSQEGCRSGITVNEKRGKARVNIAESLGNGRRRQVPLPIDWSSENVDAIRDAALAVYRNLVAGRPIETVIASLSAAQCDDDSQDPSPVDAGLINWPALVEAFRERKIGSGEIKPTTWSNTYVRRMRLILAAVDRCQTPVQLLEAITAPWANQPGCRGRQLQVQQTAALLRWGVDTGRLPATWAPPLDLTPYVGRRRETASVTTPLTVDEIQSLVEAIPDPKWRYAFQLLSAYGLRPEELQHLEVRNGRLWCNYSKVSSRGKTEPRPLRLLPCDPWAAAWNLEATFRSDRLPPMKPGLGADSMGLYMRRRALWRELRRRYEEQGEKLVLYSCRHAYAHRAHTLCPMLPTKFVAAAMGHSLETHLAAYSRWIGDDEVDAAFERASQRMEQDLRAG